jgi:hypothetical protein
MPLALGMLFFAPLRETCFSLRFETDLLPEKELTGMDGMSKIKKRHYFILCIPSIPVNSFFASFQKSQQPVKSINRRSCN